VLREIDRVAVPAAECVHRRRGDRRRLG
jgi:hypothetical protein